MKKTTHINRRQLLLAPMALATVVTRAAGPMQFVHLVPVQGPMINDAKSLGVGLQAGFDESVLANVRDAAFNTVVELEGPDGFIRQLSRICSQGPTVLLAPHGPVAVTALLRSGILDKNELLVINPIPGAEAFRHPGHAKVLHVRASDSDQVRRIIQHAHTIGIKRFSVVTEMDGTPAAESLWRAGEHAASKTGVLEVQHVQIKEPLEIGQAIVKTDFQHKGSCVLDLHLSWPEHWTPSENRALAFTPTRFRTSRQTRQPVCLGHAHMESLLPRFSPTSDRFQCLL